MDVGKAAIAASLMRHENQEWIVDSPDWYRRLFSEMTDAKSFSANQLGIVTFNYDRSLEYFFTRCLPSRYHVTPEKAVEWFSKIPIVHLYGSLGALPEYSSTGRAYGKGGSDAIIAASQGIHLARGGADPETFATARQMMSKASRIIVIGFGFEKINSARLGLMEFASSAQIYATTYKMCRVDQAVIQATHPPYKTPDEPEYSEDPYVEWFDGNALAFMEHHGIANPVE